MRSRTFFGACLVGIAVTPAAFGYVLRASVESFYLGDEAEVIGGSYVVFDASEEYGYQPVDVYIDGVVSLAKVDGDQLESEDYSFNANSWEYSCENAYVASLYYTVPEDGGCFYGRSVAVDGNWYYFREVTSGSQCWSGTPACALSVYVNSGGFITQGGGTGVYTCGITMELNASPLQGWHFDGWSSDVNSANQTIEFVIHTSMSVYANFSESSPSPPSSPDGSTIGYPIDPLDGRGPTSPIVIHMARGSFVLGSLADPVVFDLNADGRAERLTWTRRGEPDAFLAVDRNRNGQIDDGKELFGNHTPLGTGEIASNGFEALREFDDNRDGVIDKHDRRWSDLLLWTDWDHDGRSTPEEVVPIATSPVSALRCDYHLSGRHDRNGNYFRYESIVILSSSSAPYYDVYFATLP